MKIAIIGAGRVGSALAQAFIKAGHTVIMGIKFPMSEKSVLLATKIGEDRFTTVEGAAGQCEVIVMAATAQYIVDIAKRLGDVSEKIIIDTMNSGASKPDGFTNTTDAILAHCNAKDVVKCFNTTGVENIENPIYPDGGIDMFVAGDSQKGKTIATQFALEIGFATCYDFGGNNKFLAMEQLASVWINLAIMQKQGRDIALKIVKR